MEFESIQVTLSTMNKGVEENEDGGETALAG